MTDANSQTYTYDGENKMVSASNGSGTIGQYYYDGDGKRVKKVVPGTGETTIFVCDAAGKEVAEYSTVVANSTDAKVNYLTTDHLGSPRINTDQNGAIISRHDYLPFGEEIDGTGGRTTGLNYGNDTVRKQFTGYEKDNETDSDYAKARMYSGNYGRFTTPDPLQLSGSLSQPQIWNRYVYGINNPLKFVDPLGLAHTDPFDVWVGDENGEYDKDLDAHWNAKKKRWDFVNQGSPVQSLSWGESETNRMVFQDAQSRHRNSLTESIYRQEKQQRQDSLIARTPPVPTVPRRIALRDPADCKGDRVCLIVLVTLERRRRMNVGAISSGGVNQDPRGGRGRFQGLEDSMDQHKGIRRWMDTDPAPGWDIDDTKSSRRVQNDLEEFNGKSYEEIMQELEGEGIPIEEPIEPIP